MIFEKHVKPEGLHAPFSASSSAWLRYNDDKALEVYNNKKAAEMGTKLHAWAKPVSYTHLGATNSEDLERMVNDFCMDKTIQDIKYQSMYVGTKFNQYSGAILEGIIVDRAMVMYAD